MDTFENHFSPYIDEERCVEVIDFLISESMCAGGIISESMRVENTVAWKQLSAMVAAINGSDFFDPPVKLLAPSTQTMKSVQQMREANSRASGGTPETTIVDNFPRMVQLVSSAMSGFAPDFFPWALSKSKRSTEDDWHLKSDNCCDHFQLRRYFALLIMTVSDSNEDTIETNMLVSQAGGPASSLASVTSSGPQRAGYSQVAGSADMSPYSSNNVKASSSTSMFEVNRTRVPVMKGRVRNAANCRRIVQCLLDGLRANANNPQFNATLVFGALNGALLISAAGEREDGEDDAAPSKDKNYVDADGDGMEDEDPDEVEGAAQSNAGGLFSRWCGAAEEAVGGGEEGDDPTPSKQVQCDLAELGACTLVTMFISPTFPSSLSTRVARLGCLLLSGGNKSVQAEFQRAEEADCLDNRKSEFLLYVRRWLRVLVISKLAVDKQLCTRILSMVQLLCEGHNRWWQDELRDQQRCTVVVDLVGECATLVVKHAAVVVNRTPSASRLKALPNSDPQLKLVVADLQLLEQFCATLSEWCQGPCVANQAKCLESGAVDATAETLWWLSRRQMGMIPNIKALEGNPGMKDRHTMLTERLKCFRDVEGNIIGMLTSIVEGGNEENVEKTIIALHKAKIPGLGDGIDCLMGGMNLHGANELLARREGDITKVLQEDTPTQRKGDLIGPPCLFFETGNSSATVNIINNYYMLLRNLSDHNRKVKETFEKWKQPEHADVVLFARKHLRKSVAKARWGRARRLTTAIVRMGSPRSEQLQPVRGNYVPAARRAVEDAKMKHTEPWHYKPEHILAEVAGVVKTIEVQRDGALESIYFPVPRSCIDQLDAKFVTDYLHNFKQGLCRDNPRARVIDLVAKLEEYKNIWQHQKWIASSRWMKKLCKIALVVDQYNIVVTLMINIVMLLFLNERYEETPSTGRRMLDSTANSTGSNSTSTNALAQEARNTVYALWALKILATIHVWTATLKVVGYYLQHPLLAYFLEIKFDYDPQAVSEEEQALLDDGEESQVQTRHHNALYRSTDQRSEHIVPNISCACAAQHARYQRL